MSNVRSKKEQKASENFGVVKSLTEDHEKLRKVRKKEPPQSLRVHSTAFDLYFRNSAYRKGKNYLHIFLREGIINYSRRIRIYETVEDETNDIFNSFYDRFLKTPLYRDILTHFTRCQWYRYKVPRKPKEKKKKKSKKQKKKVEMAWPELFKFFLRKHLGIDPPRTVSELLFRMFATHPIFSDEEHKENSEQPIWSILQNGVMKKDGCIESFALIWFFCGEWDRFDSKGNNISQISVRVLRDSFQRFSLLFQTVVRAYTMMTTGGYDNVFPSSLFDDMVRRLAIETGEPIKIGESQSTYFISKRIAIEYLIGLFVTYMFIVHHYMKIRVGNETSLSSYLQDENEIIRQEIVIKGSDGFGLPKNALMKFLIDLVPHKTGKMVRKSRRRDIRSLVNQFFYDIQEDEIIPMKKVLHFFMMIQLKERQTKKSSVQVFVLEKYFEDQMMKRVFLEDNGENNNSPYSFLSTSTSPAQIGGGGLNRKNNKRRLKLPDSPYRYLRYPQGDRVLHPTCAIPFVRPFRLINRRDSRGKWHCEIHNQKSIWFQFIEAIQKFHEPLDKKSKKQKKGALYELYKYDLGNRSLSFGSGSSSAEDKIKVNRRWDRKVSTFDRPGCPVPIVLFGRPALRGIQGLRNDIEEHRTNNKIPEIYDSFNFPMVESEIYSGMMGILKENNRSSILNPNTKPKKNFAVRIKENNFKSFKNLSTWFEKDLEEQEEGEGEKSDDDEEEEEEEEDPMDLSLRNDIEDVLEYVKKWQFSHWVTKYFENEVLKSILESIYLYSDFKDEYKQDMFIGSSKKHMYYTEKTILIPKCIQEEILGIKRGYLYKIFQSTPKDLKKYFKYGRKKNDNINNSSSSSSSGYELWDYFEKYHYRFVNGVDDARKRIRKLERIIEENDHLKTKKKKLGKKLEKDLQEYQLNSSSRMSSDENEDKSGGSSIASDFKSRILKNIEKSIKSCSKCDENIKETIKKKKKEKLLIDNEIEKINFEKEKVIGGCRYHRKKKKIFHRTLRSYYEVGEDKSFMVRKNRKGKNKTDYSSLSKKNTKKEKSFFNTIGFRRKKKIEESEEEKEESEESEESDDDEKEEEEEEEVIAFSSTTSSSDDDDSNSSFFKSSGGSKRLQLPTRIPSNKIQKIKKKIKKKRKKKKKKKPPPKKSFYIKIKYIMVLEPVSDKERKRRKDRDEMNKERVKLTSGGEKSLKFRRLIKRRIENYGCKNMYDDIVNIHQSKILIWYESNFSELIKNEKGKSMTDYKNIYKNIIREILIPSEKEDENDVNNENNKKNEVVGTLPDDDDFKTTNSFSKRKKKKKRTKYEDFRAYEKDQESFISFLYRETKKWEIVDDKIL